MTKALVADALRAAYWRNKPKPGLMHHSDRGSQCCSAAYRALQCGYGMSTSMSRKGNCWDTQSMMSIERLPNLTRAGTGYLPLR